MDFELKKNLIVLLILIIVTSVLFYANLKNNSPSLFKYATYIKFYFYLLNYFYKLSQGHISLISTFWLWNILFPAFLFRFVISVENLILFNIFFIIYHTSALIFLSRSATKYMKDYRSLRIVWAYLSFLYIILMIALLLFLFISLFIPSILTFLI